MGLIDVSYYEINPGKASGTGLMVQPVVIRVPTATRKVHLAITTMHFSFDSCASPTSAPLSQISYEITNRNESKLKQGEFTCDFKAILLGDNPAAQWCGYFVLEILCFD